MANLFLLNLLGQLLNILGLGGGGGLPLPRPPGTLLAGQAFKQPKRFPTQIDLSKGFCLAAILLFYFIRNKLRLN